MEANDVMKIGIFTLPFHSNYGGILQAWALQETVKALGHDPIILDHKGFNPCWALQPIVILRRAAMRLRGDSVPLLGRLHDLYLEWEIAKFVKSRLQRSPYLSSSKHLAKFITGERIAAVLAGSDQIWNPCMANSSYFLDFMEGTSAKRIVYAASFGSDHVDYGKRQHRYETLARRFDAVSVREDIAVETCRSMFGIQSTQVLDPTLLVPTDAYKAIMEPQPPTGLVTYFLAGQKRFGRLASETAKAMSASQTVIPTANDEIDTFLPRPMPSVEKWLGTLAAASHILTDSFHGTVFSILFGKPFAVFDNATGSGRIKSILHVFGMEDRMLPPNAGSAEIAKILKMPLPSGIDKKLDTERNKSLNWLDKAIKH